MSIGIVFHAGAAFIYGILAIFLWRLRTTPDCLRAARRFTRLGLLGALLIQGIALCNAIFFQGALYIGGALLLSAVVWLGLVIFWLENLVVEIDGLLFLLLPAAAIVCALAGLFPQGQVVPHANNTWLRIHLIIALIAYGLMTIAVLQALLMALLDRYLHRPVAPIHARPRGRVLPQILDLQPPLLMQENLLFRIVAVGFIALTLTVGTGSIASYSLSQQVLPLDHKTLFTLLAWLNFGVLLLGRYLKGWRGRVALRWTLAGFALLILTYTGLHSLI